MSYTQRDIDDVAWGKRVVTPKMRRAKRWQSFKSGAVKAASATGKGLKYIGKETYESGKYIYKDLKSTRPKIKPMTSKKFRKPTLNLMSNYEYEMPKMNFI